MRTSLAIALVCLPAFCVSCADEREYPARSLSPVIVPIEEVEDARVPVIDPGPSKPQWSDAGFGVQPIDAGSPLVDARVDANWADARPDADAAYDAYVDAYVDAAEPDAGPEWEIPTGLQVGPVSFATDCNPAVPAPTDNTCRTWPWHKPACFQTPLICTALYEDNCAALDIDGAPIFVGVYTGATCRGEPFRDYFASVGELGSFDRLAGDVFTTARGVVKHALSDGSFDTAPASVSALFVQNDQLVVLDPEGNLMKYPSWEDLKAGTNAKRLLFYSPDSGTKFGANDDRIAALWPSGLLDIITSDGARTGIYLENYSPWEYGPATGIDLDESGTLLYVANGWGISTYDVTNGKLVRRIAVPNLQGLACQTGRGLGTEIPPMPGSARPGYYYPEREDSAILYSDNCAGPFNGPRYYGQTSGPELLVIATYFHQPSLINDTRTKPHTLVLTSIQSTEWTVNVTPGAALERIIVNGSPADVKVVSATPIPIEHHADAESFGAFNGTWPSPEESELRQNLEAYTGRSVTELLGCHLGSTYTVRDVAPLCALP